MLKAQRDKFCYSFTFFLLSSTEILKISQMEDLSWPEPAPNWPEAKKTWGLGWEFHVYAFAGIWIMAAFYYLIFFVQSIVRRNDGRKRSPFIMLSFQLLIHALCRCLVLFLNPYGSRSKTQVTLVTGITAWSLGTAGLISAFGVLLLMLLDATKLNIAPPKFQSLAVLIVITLATFVFVILTDVVVAFNRSAKLLLLACHLLLGAWGMTITVGFFVAANRTRRNLAATFQDLAPQVNNEPSRKNELVKLRGLIIKCYLSSALGFCIFGLSLYAMVFGGSSVLSNESSVDSWTWWSFQTTFRVLELLMNLLITVIALGTTHAAE